MRTDSWQDGGRIYEPLLDADLNRGQKRSLLYGNELHRSYHYMQSILGGVRTRVVRQIEIREEMDIYYSKNEPVPRENGDTLIASPITAQRALL